ncbi:MAG: DNA polymerase III subunit gamma/tau [Gemmataceae bacterium]
MAKAKPSPVESKPASEEPAYTVVARRYRPQQFTDLIGQEHVATALTNAITSGRIAHAYLFTGARGTGKTSSARILAKALNCVKGPTPTPCDKCDICLRIAEGEDTDAVEIDGASNNKADEARELRNAVGFRPTRARFKIYIIDEVHMLSTAAFNVLLKTLEEPPPHVKFIFATTEVQKIPITILSRCQRFDFAHINATKVFETLKHIVSKEGLKAEDAALRIVAKRSAGSMRDAQTLLEQLLSVTDGKLTAETVHNLLGTADDDRIAELATAILAKDAKQAVDLVADSGDRGLQMGELLDQLTDYWRSMMLVSVGGSKVSEVVASPTLAEQVAQHAAVTNLDTILAGLDVLSTTRGRMRGSPHVDVLVEMAVVRLCRLDELVSVNQLVRVIAEGGVSAPAAAPAPRPAASLSDGPVKKNSIKAPDSAPVDSSGPIGLTAENAREIWPKVIEAVGLMGGRALKSAGLPAILGPNALALRFPANYIQHYDQASAGLDALVEAIKRVTGQDWSVRFEKSAPDTTDIEPVRTPAASSAGRQKAILEHPLFKRIADRLGGQMVKMEEGFNPTALPPKPVTAPLVSDDDDGEALPPTSDSEEDEG